jgi:hypothetical protein
MLYTIGFGLVAAGVAGGFYCGWAYRGAELPAPAPAAAAAPASVQPARGGFLGRPVVSGRVVSVKGGTIVVHDAGTDTDVSVVLAPGATVTRTQSVSVKPSALTTSDDLIVSGQPQADGSVVATGAVVTGGVPVFRVAGPAATPAPR